MSNHNVSPETTDHDEFTVAQRQCATHIRQHSRMSQLLAVGATVSVVALALFAFYYGKIEGLNRDREYLQLLAVSENCPQTLQEIEWSIQRFEREAAEAQIRAKQLEVHESPAEEIGAKRAEAESARRHFEEAGKQAERQAAHCFDVRRQLDERYLKAKPVLSDSFVLAFTGILILILTVFTGLYRMHLKEMSRHEHYLIGFVRTRIAARSGAVDESAKALTDGAFSPPEGKANRRFESPLPGHPTTEAATFAIEKAFDLVERFGSRPPGR